MRSKQSTMPSAIGRHPPGESGATAPGHHRDAVLVGPPQDGDHIVRRSGEDDGQGRHGIGRQSLVVGVVDGHGRAAHDMGRTERLAKLFE